MITAKMGVKDLISNLNKLNEFDYIEIEDKKSKKLKGVFISAKLAMEFKKFLEEKSDKETEEKLKAFRNMIKLSDRKNPFLEQFDKDDPKILQKVKGMSE
ncbi:hypothetical protein Hipma_0733 [Hippea maritima DSM 10411]|uniref:Uncharacterized protein n=2 Tax=Hippea TaxID=84404 RepID=F2LVB9_HIPMA|nr:hypothetical protein Hipma_0733 [Hippea maritima DSM 10411]